MDQEGKFKRDFGLYRKIGNLKAILMCNVTSRGDSLCVVIPKDVVDVNGVMSGDKVRVWFLDHYRLREYTKKRDK